MQAIRDMAKAAQALDASEVIIDPDAGVYPMVGPGQSYDAMITGDHIVARHPPKSTEAPGPSQMF